MTTKSIKLIAFLVLLVHGIGHFQGVVAGLGIKINDSEPAKSWLLISLGDRAGRYLSLVLFLLTGVAGILTALSFKDLLIPFSQWQLLAMITAFLSTVCLVIFPNGFAMFFNKAGAILVNLLIYYSIVFGQHWPSAIFEE